jgi:hypothetical protein
VRNIWVFTRFHILIHEIKGISATQLANLILVVKTGIYASQWRNNTPWKIGKHTPVRIILEVINALASEEFGRRYDVIGILHLG